MECARPQTTPEGARRPTYRSSGSCLSNGGGESLSGGASTGWVFAGLVAARHSACRRGISGDPRPPLVVAADRYAQRPATTDGGALGSGACYPGGPLRGAAGFRAVLSGSTTAPRHRAARSPRGVSADHQGWHCGTEPLASPLPPPAVSSAAMKACCASGEDQRVPSSDRSIRRAPGGLAGTLATSTRPSSRPPVVPAEAPNGAGVLSGAAGNINDNGGDGDGDPPLAALASSSSSLAAVLADERERHRLALDRAWQKADAALVLAEQRAALLERCGRDTQRLAQGALLREEAMARGAVAAAAAESQAALASAVAAAAVRALADALAREHAHVCKAAPVRDSDLLRALRQTESRVAQLERHGGHAPVCRPFTADLAVLPAAAGGGGGAPAAHELSRGHHKSGDQRTASVNIHHNPPLPSKAAPPPTAMFTLLRHQGALLRADSVQ